MTTAALIHHERSTADKLGAQAAIATHLAQECASQKAQLAKHRAARARLLQKLKIERQRTRGAMAMHAEAVAAGEKAEAELDAAKLELSHAPVLPGESIVDQKLFIERMATAAGLPLKEWRDAWWWAQTLKHESDAMRQMCEDLRPIQQELSVEAWGRRLSQVAMERLTLAKADTARIDCLARHPLKAAIKGGPDDGAEARVWAVSGDPSWNLRQVIDSLRVKDGEKL